MSYRNSERKTQEMQNTIALAVAVARAMLLRRRRFFCDEEDVEEDKVGSVDIFSLSLVVFCVVRRRRRRRKEARFSLASFFRMDFFQFISRHYINYRESAREQRERDRERL